MITAKVHREVWKYSSVCDASIAALMDAAQRETARYLCGDTSDDAPAFELFRRAICERNERAWAALFDVYGGIVGAWVRMHPAAPADRADDVYWMNRAFERLWAAVTPERFALFPTVAALLRYLKMCVHSVLLDARRVPDATCIEALAPYLVDTRAVGATAVEEQLRAQALWEAVVLHLHDDADRLVATLCLVLDMKPREVYERHTEVFASVAEVYRAKRNLLERLQRSAMIRDFLD